LPWSIGTNVGNILAPALYSSDGKVRHASNTAFEIG
jgi:hypothetical protein